MTKKKSKERGTDMSLSLFTEEDMAGKIENVTVMTAPVPEAIVDAEQPEHDAESSPAAPSPVAEEPLDDDRMIAEMAGVLRQLSRMDAGKVRQIALTATAACQQGVDLQGTYRIPAIGDETLNGYQMAAWLYCSFMKGFPGMSDKLQLPYADCYRQAMVESGIV
jgi:hypothetical protein